LNQENSLFGEPFPNNLFEDIQELKNSGATCDTFKVRLHNKWFFLKRIKQEFKSNPLYIAAFEKEFDLGFHLDHPNIVRYQEKGTDQEGLYIITEYIDGLNLKEFFQANPFAVKDKKFIDKLIRELLSALDYLHNNQIYHLDIKLENILISAKSTNIKLIDLGFSASDSYQAVASGTPNSSSPEQFENPQLVDARSDIYAFGKLLLAPYSLGDNLAKMPLRYKSIAEKCIQESPVQRFSSIREIIEIIEYKKKRRNILGLSLIIFISLILFTVSFNYINQATLENKVVKINPTRFSTEDLITLRDSLSNDFEKEFPTLSLSNLYDASARYNLKRLRLFEWKQNRLNSVELQQRPYFEAECNRICNEWTEKYILLFKEVSENHNTILTSQNSKSTVVLKQSSFEDSIAIERIMKSSYPYSIKIYLAKYANEVSTEKKLRHSIQNRLNELFKPVSDYLKANDINLNKQIDINQTYLKELYNLFVVFNLQCNKVNNEFAEKLTCDPELQKNLNAITNEEIDQFKLVIKEYVDRYR
jgi:serine/threonine protein kinase